MIYLVLYLAIGITLLGTVLVQVYLDRKRSKSAKDLADAFVPDSDELSLAKRIFKKIIQPIFGGALIITAWPLALIYVAIDLFVSARKKKTKEPVKFAVSEDDLKEKLSIAEIEDRELISDPLNAVPNLPFGHLNSTWVKYLENIEPDCELWSFDAQGRSVGCGPWQSRRRRRFRANDTEPA